MQKAIHKSRKKAAATTVAGFFAGIAGGLILQYTDDTVVGWCFVITAFFTLLYGIGSLFDRKPYILLTEHGITDLSTIREEIEWDAILHADDFYFRGQYWVRLILDGSYKPQIVSSLGFRRFDRLYSSKGLKAVFIRTSGLEIGSMQLVGLIDKMREADLPQRIELLQQSGRRYFHRHTAR